MPRSRSRYEWDTKLLRYRDAQGRFVSQARIFHSLDRTTNDSARVMRRLAGQLQRGQISTVDFQLAMRDEIKRQHITATVIARGGREQMTTADWGRLGARLREEYKHLDRFARSIANNEMPLQSRKIITRAAAYSNNPRVTYFAEMQRVGLAASERGREPKAVRVLGIVETEHCESCKREAARPPMPVSRIKPIGSLVCMGFCHCQIVFVDNFVEKNTNGTFIA